jgi:tetratricopeptide (TPR) repeat protein/predicted Ser/Thr protein kinase
MIDKTVSHYKILEHLGSGGMGVVYKAQDLKLDRFVALKFLPPSFGPDEAEKQRFIHEAKAASALDHTNICTIFEINEIDDGQMFIAMAYYDGETLKKKIERGDMKVDEVIDLCIQVAEGLTIAHQKDIIHRDIKPANILVTDIGVVKIVDFGLAKLAGQTKLTKANTTLGTTAYMSPEQTRGEEVDHRTDIWSYGVVLYEMLTGELPFKGEYDQAVMYSIMNEEPPAPSSIGTEISPSLENILARCLEKDPGQRFSHISELVGELRQVPEKYSGQPPTTDAAVALPWGQPRQVLALLGTASLAVLAIAYVLTMQLGLPDWVLPAAVALLVVGFPIIWFTGRLERRRTIARRTGSLTPEADSAWRRWFTWRNAVGGGVLAFAGLGIITSLYMAMRLLGIGPVGTLMATGVLQERDRIIIADFENHTSDSLLAGALTEALRVDLAQSPLVTLVEPGYLGRVLAQMNRRADEPLGLALAREVAIREGIKAVIAGEINAVGTGLVLSTRLVSAEDGGVLAAYRETADKSAAIIRAIDRLSKRLRERIGESLKTIRRNEPLDRVTTASLEALRKYSQAVRALEIEGDDDKGITLLEEAVSRDTAFAMAWRKLGVAFRNRRQERARAVEALTKAFQHRDRLTDRERYMTLGSYYSLVTYEQDKAITAYRTLLDTYPNDTWALNNLALLYSELRDYVQAEELARRALELDSLNARHYTNVVAAQGSRGMFDEAAATLERMSEKLPGHPSVNWYSALVASARGEYDVAEAHVRALRDARRGSLYWRARTSGMLADLARVRGRLADAERYLRDAMAANEERGLAAEYLYSAVDLARLDVWFRDARDRGLRQVEAALHRYPLDSITALDRPYLWLAQFYAFAERPDRARVLLTEYEAAIDVGLRRDVPPWLQITQGIVALAEGRFREAIAEFRRLADESACPICPLPDLGRAYDLTGETDSVIVIYERYLTTPWLWRLGWDSNNLALIYERLAELYEQRGEPEKAIYYSDRLVKLWKGADSELQPRVEHAYRRLQRLLQEKVKEPGETTKHIQSEKNR